LAEQVPPNAEVVVEYRPVLTPLHLPTTMNVGGVYSATAIALIPKGADKDTGISMSTQKDDR
jgi:hypothetical protein